MSEYWLEDADLPTAVQGQGDPAAWANKLATWAKPKSRVKAQLEDSQFGGEVGGSWHTALQNAINALPQDEPGVMGGEIEVYPDQHRLNGTVTLTGKRSIGIVAAGGPSHIDGGHGFGASFYAGTSGMTMFHHAATGGLNHWGPYFEGINFLSPDFQNTTLVHLEAVNHWKFRRCCFNYGGTQLKVDARLDLSGGHDASYGELLDVTWSHYTNYGFHMVSGQCKGHDLKWFEGVAGSWALRWDGQVANASLHGLKLDTLANGMWLRCYVCSFYHVACEGSLVGVRFDADPAVGFSGHDNRIFDLHTTFRGAGETGIDVTSTAGRNSVLEFYHQGTGTPITDPTGKLFIVTSYDAAGQPMIQMPDRPSAPPAPANGARLYSRAGLMRSIGSADGTERTI